MFLLDTSSLSEPLRRHPRPAFMKRLREIRSEDLYTSSICVMELRYGCILKTDDDLWNRIQERLLSLVQILPFGGSEAIRCGELLALLSKRGGPIRVEDAQIAATALTY